MNYPIIYLHIPKTAGTSFRISAAKYFGNEQVLYDYGDDSESTSPALLGASDSELEAHTIVEAARHAKMLSGHFSFTKYKDLFPDLPVVSFFRDPVDRVISEYVHFKNHHRYTGTLEEFYRCDRFQNRQHKCLGGIKPTDLDFFGLTERYEQSLEMFNEKYGTEMKLTTLNRGNYGKRDDRIEPTAQQIAEIKHLNQADIALYTIAVEHFTTQKPASWTSKASVTRYNGNFGGIRRDRLYGWIHDTASDGPTEICVFVNGEKRISLLADSDRPDILRHGLSSRVNCGFFIPTAKLGPLSPHDSISVRSSDDRYELLNSPLVISTADSGTG
jgi:hypothetical protein